jgi:RNA 2',3'-cyclic 3'-phosphodiesterase
VPPAHHLLGHAAYSDRLLRRPTQTTCSDGLLRPPSLGLVRLFVAVRPPETALAQLADLVQRLRAEAPELTWTTPAQWHLTLVFLADVADQRVPELERRLGSAAARHGRERLSIAGGGCFGDRVLFAKLTGDVDALRRLAASVQAAARRSGLDVEDRRYRPHLTLARGRRGADVRALVPHLNAFTGSAWGADEIELVRSRLGKGPGGRAAHETLRSWPLRAGTPG